MDKYKIGEIVLITTSKNLQELGLPAVFKGKILEFIEANIVSIEAKEFFPVGHAIVGLEAFVCGKCATKLGTIPEPDKAAKERQFLLSLLELIHGPDHYAKLSKLQKTARRYGLEIILK